MSKKSAKKTVQRRRPNQERAKDMVASILAGATRVLIKDGLKGFTTNKVAAAAGISIGSLYQYFTDKDAIAMAVVEQQYARIVELIAQGMAQNIDQPIEVSVRAIITSVLDAIHGDQDVYLVLRQRLEGTAGAKRLDELLDDVVNIVAVALAMRPADHRKDVSPQAAFVLVQAINGVATSIQRKQPSEAEYAELIHEVGTLALRYLT